MTELLEVWSEKLRKNATNTVVKLAIISYFGTLFACTDPVKIHPLLRYGRQSLQHIYAGKPERRLIKAIVADDYDTVKQLIETDVDVNVVGKYGAIPLDWPLFTNNYDMFLFLLENGANPNLQTNHNPSLMAAAVYESDFRFLEAAILHGGDVNLVSLHDSDTPIYSAVIGRQFKNIDILLENGANINYQNDGGETPMLVAAITLKYDVVYYLIRKGADPFIKNIIGYDLLYFLNIHGTDPKLERHEWREKILSYIDELKR